MSDNDIDAAKDRHPAGKGSRIPVETVERLSRAASEKDSRGNDGARDTTSDSLNGGFNNIEFSRALSEFLQQLSGLGELSSTNRTVVNGVESTVEIVSKLDDRGHGAVRLRLTFGEDGYRAGEIHNPFGDRADRSGAFACGLRGCLNCGSGLGECGPNLGDVCIAHNSSPSVCACGNRPLGEGGSSSPRHNTDPTEGEPLSRVVIDLGDAGRLTITKDMLPDLISWLQIAQAEMGS